MRTFIPSTHALKRPPTHMIFTVGQFSEHDDYSGWTTWGQLSSFGLRRLTDQRSNEKLFPVKYVRFRYQITFRNFSLRHPHNDRRARNMIALHVVGNNLIILRRFHPFRTLIDTRLPSTHRNKLHCIIHTSLLPNYTRASCERSMEMKIIIQ